MHNNDSDFSPSVLSPLQFLWVCYLECSRSWK